MTKLNFTNGPLIMGILNVTPDSFSGDGIMCEQDFLETALKQSRQMLDDGAHILDIGGESSRPGSTPLSAEEELRRVVPVVQIIRDQLGNNPVLSIDTTKASVAKAALQAGADIINDVSALTDPDMGKIIAETGCPVVLMHNRTKADAFQQTKTGAQYDPAHYDDVVEDVKRKISQAVDIAKKSGVLSNQIILDPGLGFGKSVEQNLALIKHIPSLKQLGFPVMMGPSRKSFIGAALDLPVDERMEGTAATVAIGAFLGADIIRVHDVKFMARVAKMATAIRNS